MSIFDSLLRKSRTRLKAEQRDETPAKEKTQPDLEALKSLRLYDAAQRDTAYQKQLAHYFELVQKINERYSVLNNTVGFSTPVAKKLISDCEKAIALELNIQEKRDFYDNMKHLCSPPSKTLSMVYEKRGEYSEAISVCVNAIYNGFPDDNTVGQMRGRIARLLKKGGLPLTDELKSVLDLE